MEEEPEVEDTSTMLSTKLLGTFRQYAATLIVNLGVFGLGTVIGWSSPALPSMEEDIRLTTLDKSWIGSIVNLGGLLGCLVGGFALDKFGRKLSMILFTIPFMIGWIIVILMTDLAMLLVGRFILGFAAAFYGVSGPTFVGEIAQEHIRGILSNMYGVALTLGFLFSYTLGSFVNWKILSIVSATVPVSLFLFLLLIPESPRHLLLTGKREAGSKALQWYRGYAEGSEEAISSELSKIEASLDEMKEQKGKKTTLHEMLEGPALKPLLISIALAFFEQFSGFAAIVAYTADIFRAGGIKQEDSNVLTIIFGVAQVLATIVSAALIDRVGRRALLISGQVFIVASLTAMGGYFYAQGKNGGITPEGFSWVPLTCLIVYIVAFSIGIGPISTTLMGELLPQNIRGIGSAVCTAVLRIIAFLISFGFENVGEALGTHWSFWIFAVSALLGLIFCVIFVPETKGKTLEDIRAYFSK